MRLGEKLCILRKRRGMSQDFVAEGLKDTRYPVTQSYVSSIERDTKKLVVKKKGAKDQVTWIPKTNDDDGVNSLLALEIARFLGVPVDWLIDPDAPVLEDKELKEMQVLRDLIVRMGESRVLERLASGDVIAIASPANHSPERGPRYHQSTLPREKTSDRRPRRRRG